MGDRLGDRQADGEQRVTPLELFFDLVVVFAITQVTGLLSRSPTWGGLLRGLLLLGALWWAWAAYAWLTNTLDPEEGTVRLAVLAAIAAMLVVSLAAPGAFGRDGVAFGVAYFVVRALHLVVYAIAGRGDRDLFRAVVRIVPTATLAPALLVIAGFLGGSGQLALWGAALAIDYLGAMAGRMRGWRVSPAHFVERFGLIIIIALGESIVAIGVGAAGLPLDAGVIAAALLGITIAACLWWSYFDWVIYVAQATLAEATGARRAALARDAYSYLHLPMVGGIVLFAFGLKTTLADVAGSLRTVPALGLVGGIALYLLAHVALRLRLGAGLGRGRPVASVLLLGLLPVARGVPALAALGIVAAVCASLIGYEALRYREARAWIRSRRGAFTMEEASRVEMRRRDRRPREGDELEIQPKQPTAKGPADLFTGDVWFDVIAKGEGPSRIRVNTVRFPPGARTAWHAHAVGQTLHVTEGRGLVQARGGEIVEIRPGDTVHAPPGEWHWHGAAPDQFMTHIAMWEAPAEGPESDWGAQVTDAEYLGQDR